MRNEELIYIPDFLKYAEPDLSRSEIFSPRACITLNTDCCKDSCYACNGECGSCVVCVSCVNEGCGEGCGEGCTSNDVCSSCDVSSNCSPSCTAAQNCVTLNAGCCNDSCYVCVGEGCGACVICVSCVNEGCGEGCGEGCASCYSNQCVGCVMFQGGQLATPVLTKGAVSASTIEVAWVTVANANEAILERKLTTSTSWSGTGYATTAVPFGNLKATWNSLTPNTSYDFRIKAHQTGTTYSDSNWSNVITQKTLIRPLDFAWTVPPQTGGWFDETVTWSDWRRLQDTINAWRGVAGTSLFSFYNTFNGEGSFTLPVQGARFDVMYFWQVLNAIKTIPKFNGTLPTKPSRGDVCYAKDFQSLVVAVNSLSKVYQGGK